jgi:hypothetical protein
VDTTLRKATHLPLDELWRPDGTTFRIRLRELEPDEISEMLRKSSIEFVVADVGRGLLWIAPGACFHFWKTEIKPHLAKVDSRILLDSFPGGYCYTASEWSGIDGDPLIVLLERHH